LLPHQAISQHSSQMEDVIDVSGTGATSFRGHSSQIFGYASSLYEDPTQAVQIKITMMLAKQYRHQRKIQDILLRDLKYPKIAGSLIGEYLYTQCVFDKY